MKQLLLLLLLFTTNIVAQEFVTSSSFDSKTAKGTVVIEFYVEWNDGNKVAFLPSLKDCNVYRVCIAKSADLQSEYKVTSVPTVIIFDNGVEQSVIDIITFNKFQ
jgi:hypothetical protein